MTTTTPVGASGTLVDALDHLLNQGAVLAGEATLSLGGVDLVYVGLNLLIASVETLRASGATPRPPLGPARAPAPRAPYPDLSPVATGERSLLSSTSSAQAPLSPAGTPGGPWSAAQGATAQPFGWHGAAQTSHDRGRGIEGPPADERPDQGLARLVLTLVELLRQLVERQALRRMEGGSLDSAQLERMGLALRDLAATMQRLCDAFGLEQEELNLDLGPLGRLLDDGR